MSEASTVANATLKFQDGGFIMETSFDLPSNQAVEEIVDGLLYNDNSKYQPPLHLKDNIASAVSEVLEEEKNNFKQDLIQELFSEWYDEDSASYEIGNTEEEQQEEEIEDVDEILREQQLALDSSLDCPSELEAARCFWTVFKSSEQSRLHLTKIEQQMNITFQNILAQREEEINKLGSQHSTVMESLYNDLSAGTSSKQETEISELCQSHVQLMAQLEQTWLKTLQATKQTQVNQFRKFVKDIYNSIKRPDTSKAVQDSLDDESSDMISKKIGMYEENNVLDADQLDLVNYQLEVRACSGEDIFASLSLSTPPPTQSATPTSSTPSSASSSFRTRALSRKVVSTLLGTLRPPGAESKNTSQPSKASSPKQTASKKEEEDWVEVEDVSPVTSVTSSQFDAAEASLPAYLQDVKELLQQLPYQTFRVRIIGGPNSSQSSSEGSLSSKAQQQLLHRYAEDDPNDFTKLNVILLYANKPYEFLSQYADKTRSEEELTQRANHMHCLFRNKLHAYVTTCTPVMGQGEAESEQHSVLANFSYHSYDSQKLLHAATETCAPELHFEDAMVQIDKLKAQINEKQVSLAEGDFFITKHSNLSWVHTMFHLLYNPNQQHQLPEPVEGEAPKIISLSTRKGITNILEYGNRIGVKDLIFQLPFCPLVKRSTQQVRLSTNEAILYHLEELLALIKADTISRNYVQSLDEPPTQQTLLKRSTLRNLIFFLPSNQSLQQSTTQIVHQVFPNIEAKLSRAIPPAAPSTPTN